MRSQKAGGGSKKIGRNKVKCERYKSKMTRYHNKLKNWIKHNIKKEATDKEKELKIFEFEEIQDKRGKCQN